MNPLPWRVVVWDLDDTLILERDYVRSGFHAVADHIAEATGIASEILADFLWSGFESGVRGNAFDRVHEAFPATSTVPVSTMVEVYRSHSPQVHIPDEALSLIKTVRSQGRYQAAITDGPLTGQKSKAAAVSLNELVDLVVFTDEWGRQYWKPHERAFLTVQEYFGAESRECVYIGDNPLKDFVAPRALGWGSVRLRREGQLHTNTSDGTPAAYESGDWTDLAFLLNAK